MNRIINKKINIKRKDNINKKLLLQVIFSIVIVVTVIITKQFGNKYMEKYFNIAKEKISETIDYKNVFTNIKANLTNIGDNLTAKILNREYSSPVNGTVIKAYGLDKSADSNTYNHGIDIISSTLSVKSISNGEVTSVGENNKMKGYVIIKKDDITIIYSMLDEVFLSKGDEVNMGELVGKLNEKSKILHLEIWQSGQSINPNTLFKLQE